MGEFSFEFDRAFVRHALRRWLRRALIAVGILVTLASFTVYAAYRGDSTFMILWAVLMTILVVAIVSYRWRTGQRRVYDLWCQQAPDRRMTYRLDEEGFEVITARASVRYEWERMRALVRDPQAWGIEVVKGAHVYFPPHAASPEQKEFIVERCRAAGVKV